MIPLYTQKYKYDANVLKSKKQKASHKILYNI